jgi:hypothetical protein
MAGLLRRLAGRGALARRRRAQLKARRCCDELSGIVGMSVRSKCEEDRAEGEELERLLRAFRDRLEVLLVYGDWWEDQEATCAWRPAGGAGHAA